MMTTTEPRIYVACLASYNAGRLHGKWIDAAQDADDIHEEIAAMLEASPIAGAEEYAIHDYEGFGSLGLSEHESIEHVAQLAELIEEHGEAFIAFYENDPSERSADEWREQFEESYNGEHASEADFAQQLADDLGYMEDAPDRWPFTCIDWESAARDLFCGDYWSSQAYGGGVHVFRSY